MGRVGDVGKNGRDVVGEEIARGQVRVGHDGDQGWSADADCSKSQAGQFESAQPWAGTWRAGDCRVAWRGAQARVAGTSAIPNRGSWHGQRAWAWARARTRVRARGPPLGAGPEQA